MASREDLEQMPCSTAFGLGLHMTHVTSIYCTSATWTHRTTGVLPRKKVWCFLLHKINLQSFNSNFVKLGVVPRCTTVVIRFQTEQVSEKTTVFEYRSIFIWLTRTAEQKIWWLTWTADQNDCFCFQKEKRSALVCTTVSVWNRYELWGNTFACISNSYKVKISIHGRSTSQSFNQIYLFFIQSIYRATRVTQNKV